MSWAVELSPHAERQLRKLDPAIRLQILTALQTLGRDPFPAPPLSKKLKGFKVATFRLRTGEYRAVYRAEGRTVTVGAVFHRRDLVREIRTLR